MSESAQAGAQVAIIMGSQSDWETMKNAAAVLDKLGVAHDCRIVSAHRTPDRLVDFAKTAHTAGFKVIIAGPAARRTCRAWSRR
jgi:5-(carboxyamino)imidazole ribonucleotide mutase